MYVIIFSLKNNLGFLYRSLKILGAANSFTAESNDLVYLKAIFCAVTSISVNQSIDQPKK